LTCGSRRWIGVRLHAVYSASGHSRLEYGFRRRRRRGIYHSVYDSFNWYTKFSDGTFE
jgi:hypothetical protein